MSNLLLMQPVKPGQTLLCNDFGEFSRKPPIRKVYFNCVGNVRPEKLIDQALMRSIWACKIEVVEHVQRMFLMEGARCQLFHRLELSRLLIIPPFCNGNFDSDIRIFSVNDGFLC